MLSWCSYCQQFQGELPPYDNFGITHGICSACEADALSLSDSDLAHARTLKALQERLAEAGRHGDLAAAQQIIEDAKKLRVREIDILLGIIAPMLYQIGEDWTRGTVTIAEEHRFTAFCKEVLELISAKVKFVLPASPMQGERVEILLMNAPGNCHTLALPMLALWLANQGRQAWIIDVPLNLDELVALVRTTQPRLLLISMMLAEQTPSVVAIAERIAQLPDPVRPKVVVGGYAVKMGLITAIPNACLIADINSL